MILLIHYLMTSNANLTVLYLLCLVCLVYSNKKVEHKLFSHKIYNLNQLNKCPAKEVYELLPHEVDNVDPKTEFIKYYKTNLYKVNHLISTNSLGKNNKHFILNLQERKKNYMYKLFILKNLNIRRRF